MSKLIITGSSGMIGSHLKKLLDHKGIDYLDINRNIWDLKEWKSNYELNGLFGNVDAIFHFAAMLPKTTNLDYKNLFDINVRSCLNVAKWALKKDIPIIFLSGSIVYKNTNKIQLNENDPKATLGLGGFYGFSKVLSENVFNHFISQGLKVIILRPSSVYGLGLGRDKMINKFLEKASKGEVFYLNEPNNKINLIHAMDVAYAAFNCFSQNKFGTFNIGSDQMNSISQIAQTVINIVKKGKASSLKISPNPLNRYNLNCDLAKKEFGFKPKISLRQGINAIYEGSMLELLF